MMATTTVHIRWMIRRDLPEMLDIERASFDFPWTEEQFVRCLRAKNCVGMAAEHEDKVVGYMVYEWARRRMDLCNLAVAAEYRRRGIGKQMVRDLRATMAQKRHSVLLANVAEHNTGGHLFFQAVGFRAVSVLRRYFPHDESDAYVFRDQTKGGS